MKQVGKIVIKPNSDFWKTQNKTIEQEAEEAANAAAQRARKEVLERAAAREAARKAYLDSIRYVDKLQFKNQSLLDKIAKVNDRIRSLNDKLHLEFDKVRALREELQKNCSHDEVIERTTKYTDEYEQWHDGHSERKCLECHLVEESSYPRDDRMYTYGSKKYDRLENSKVVLLMQKSGDKEFQLEFNDIK